MTEDIYPNVYFTTHEQSLYLDYEPSKSVFLFIWTNFFIYFAAEWKDLKVS